MKREETVRNLLTELIDMIDNGSQRDLDRADEIGASIIKLFEQEPVLDKLRAEIEHDYEQDKIAREVFRDKKIAVKAEQCTGSISAYRNVLGIIDKFKAESEG